MAEWMNCDVCGCRYSPTDLFGGPLPNADVCPAMQITRIAVFQMVKKPDRPGNQMWIERVFKHRPDWEKELYLEEMTVPA